MSRTVHVEHCMGTVFSLDLRDAGDWSSAVRDAVDLLHSVDAVFSTYREDSEVSRIRRGELRLADASDEVRDVVGLCADAQLATGGAFTAMHGGRLDPTGLVKGWSIDAVAAVLRDHGCRNFAVNGGGDVYVSGEAEPGRAWGVGIVDPHDRTRTITSVAVRDRAVATSGTAERGLHIVDPFRARPSDALASATVVGPEMTFADAYATAAFVLGRDALGWISSVDGYEAVLVTHDGELLTSAGYVLAST